MLALILIEASFSQTPSDMNDVLLLVERGARLPRAVADDGGGVRAPAGERRGPHHQTTH